MLVNRFSRNLSSCNFSLCKLPEDEPEAVQIIINWMYQNEVFLPRLSACRTSVFNPDSRRIALICLWGFGFPAWSTRYLHFAIDAYDAIWTWMDGVGPAFNISDKIAANARRNTPAKSSLCNDLLRVVNPNKGVRLVRVLGGFSHRIIYSIRKCMGIEEEYHEPWRCDICFYFTLMMMTLLFAEWLKSTLGLITLTCEKSENAMTVAELRLHLLSEMRQIIVWKVIWHKFRSSAEYIFLVSVNYAHKQFWIQ